MSNLRDVREMVAKHGLFCSLYTDRGSHYFVTPEAGGRVSKTVLTQVGRAMKQLGIEHIAPYSPQARGRSELAFSTLQNRLPKELKLAGIITIEAANRWLSEPYMAAHNKQFAIDARAGRFSVRRRCDGGLAGDPVRSGGTDGGQRQHGEAAAAEPATAAEPAARTLRQGDGAVHEYPDGRLAVYWGPHPLADWRGRHFGPAGTRPCCGRRRWPRRVRL